ncbi:TetR/AcrR family transcriptional regulator C-terminal domain-containing protein [Kribbella sp. NPDC051620]|uniref:TetR/AcrR family transcriptional regulator C-terminal domain-containing protein n=1 Tax=Kribbella sp. NPDC051620 TaxID=3364120 RepID=UPI0037A4DA69
MTDPAPSSVWTRQRPQPARRAPGVDQYVAAALAVADAEGLDAVSMRRVAGDLGSGTATLYRYITNRDELIDLMIDAVYAEDPLPEPPLPGDTDRPDGDAGSAGDWSAGLAAVAHALRATLLRHPWLAGELTGRPSLGPNSLRRSEAALRAAVALTPDITAASQALSTIRAYVLGSVAGQQAALLAEQRSGLTKEEWQHSHGPYITQILAAGEHPMLARRIHEAEEPDPDLDFTFGLDCILDGLATRFDR